MEIIINIGWMMVKLYFALTLVNTIFAYVMFLVERYDK